MIFRHPFLRKTLIALIGTMVGVFAAGTESRAQFFGISVDGAIAYSTAKKEVSGGALGITHPLPLVPNFGYTGFSFDDTEEQQSTDGNTTASMATKVSMKTVNLFYNVPFPVVSMSLGFGYGTMTTETTLTKTVTETGTNNDTTSFVTPVAEGFLHVGLPFWNLIEFHIGYHVISTAAIQRSKKSAIDISGISGIDFQNSNYSGGMSTVGIQIAF